LPFVSMLTIQAARSARAAEASLLETHTVGVVGRGGRPVGKNADHAHIPREYINNGVYVAIIVDRVVDALVVPATTACQRSATLDRPGDHLEPGSARVLRIFRRDDFAVPIQRQHFPDRRRQYSHALPA